MALETKVAQKEKLYCLLKVKKAYVEQGVEVLMALEDEIERAKAAMEADDVAYVEKQVGMK